MLRYLAVICLIWGSNWVVMKSANTYFPSILFVAWRFAFGALIMLAVAYWKKIPLPDKKILPWVILTGVMQMALQQVAIQVGLQSIGAGMGCVLNFTFPLWVAIMAHFTLNERLTRLKIFGISLAIIGLYVLMGLQGIDDLTSAFIIIAGAICSAVACVIIKLKLSRCNLMQLTTWQMTFGAIFLAIYSTIFPQGEINWCVPAVLCLFYNSVLASALAFFMWNYALMHIEVSTASIATLGAPVVGVLCGVIILGEPFTVYIALGIVLIFAGIFIVVNGKNFIARKPPETLMNFYRATRSFIGKNFVRPFEDFCALHRPEVYDYIFYRLRNTTRFEDCGDALFMKTDGLDGFVRLKYKNDFALKVPLDFPTPTANQKIAAVVHMFYPELAAEIKNFLLNIPCAVDVFISTTSLEKKIAVEKIFSDFDKGSVTIKIFDNRGRNIAATFVGFREIFDDYDVCLHLHSKISPHAEKILAGWRTHLYKNLLGSPEIVGGILKILSDERVGMVFPQHFNPIRVYVNWGKNFRVAKNFLHGLGIAVNKRNLIEFPTGSMFWFKPKALAPLIDSDLTFEDFPEECGQVDGTLAHAIERAFLFIVEASGFRWVKIDSGGNFFGATPTLKSRSQAELDANIFAAWHSVLKRY